MFRIQYWIKPFACTQEMKSWKVEFFGGWQSKIIIMIMDKKDNRERKRNKIGKKKGKEKGWERERQEKNWCCFFQSFSFSRQYLN